MKKAFTLLALGFSAGFFAQSFSLYKTSQSGLITNTITNGYVINVATIPNAPQDPSFNVLVKNNAAVTQTFSVMRSIVLQNPTLDLSGGTPINPPSTYFCFGFNCFSDNVNAPGPGDYTILLASGQSDPNVNNFPNADNSKDNNQAFVIYFKEGAAQGVYTVRYKVFNIANANDTMSFDVAYNAASVGIKNNGSKGSDMVSDVYPNPSTGVSKVFVDLGKDEELKFQVYNSLGGLVYTSSKQKYSAGKNQLVIDEELSNGVYFITLSNGVSTTTKRLIISK